MIDAFINNAKAIDMDVIVWRGLTRFRGEMVDLQKQRLSKGLLTTGKSLSGYTTPYKKVRTKHGRPTSPKDLNLTGEHYDKMYVIVQREYSQWGSNSWLSMILEHNWSEDIYGASDSDIDKILWDLGLADYIVEEYTKELAA